MNNKKKNTVMGIGYSGINIVNYIIKEKVFTDKSNIQYCTVSSDKNFLEFSLAKLKIQAGKLLTRGLGTAGDFETGKNAVYEVIDELDKIFKDTDTLYLLTGMGGGMSTGGTIAVAKRAKELNIKTVCIVSKPFDFEGKRRMNQAEYGIKQLRDTADTVILVSNDYAVYKAGPKNSIKEIYNIIHHTMAEALKNINDMTTFSGPINIELTDIKHALTDTDNCITGTGNASGKDRAKAAALNAVKSVEKQYSIINADAVIINITGGTDMTLNEMSDAIKTVNKKLGTNASVVVGCTVNKNTEEEIQVSIIAGYST